MGIELHQGGYLMNATVTDVHVNVTGQNVTVKGCHFIGGSFDNYRRSTIMPRLPRMKMPRIG